MVANVKPLRLLSIFLLAGLLAGCKFEVLFPAGDVAEQQRDILIASTLLMLLIIIPVMAFTAFFAWKYRQSNKAANYDPDWDHSTQLELLIWSAPLLIIICLGAITWASTHLLDPYRPLDRIADDQPVIGAIKPLKIDVVALDWKWLFFYPEEGVAAVNEFAAPLNRPISFRITASSVMNSFYIPALAGQIYAMPGMQTQLKAVVNKAGNYRGFSANYSGAGFSGMRFIFRGMDEAGFSKWIADAKAKGGSLDRASYMQLERPSENEPVRYYASFDPGLFKAILNLCVEPGKMCMSEMAAIDAKGGLGLQNARNVLPLQYDKYTRRGAIFGADPSYVVSLCYPNQVRTADNDGPLASQPNTSPLTGAGLPNPSSPLFLRPTSLLSKRLSSNS
jgi:cytochrome o ubiquinol oxidase subunit II